MSTHLTNEKTERMRAVYERDKLLRSKAKIVIADGEQPPVHSRETVFIETATSARLRRVFEEGEPAWWITSP